MTAMVELQTLVNEYLASGEAAALGIERKTIEVVLFDALDEAVSEHYLELTTQSKHQAEILIAECDREIKIILQERSPEYVHLLDSPQHHRCLAKLADLDRQMERLIQTMNRAGRASAEQIDSNLRESIEVFIRKNKSRIEQLGHDRFTSQMSRIAPELLSLVSTKIRAGNAHAQS